MKNNQEKRIAFQGEHGAYSEMAAIAAYGHAINFVPCQSFDEVFASVETGENDGGIVPIENSLAGTIHRNYDLLTRHTLHIVGETQLHIRHCLIVNPGVKQSDLKVIRSHPQALAQCELHLREIGVQIEAAYDTAGSVRDLRASGALDAGALASRFAAEVYEMKVLREDMQDDTHNITRFVLLAHEPVMPAGKCKTSIVFAMVNQPGALFKAIACFALRDIDLTKIESRPIPGSPWDYRFYLEFVGSYYDEPGKFALNHLREMTTELRILGTYSML